MNLGETIYRLRTERNLSQGDLADALDVSRQSVSKWENNSAVPELEKLIKMAQIFEMTLDELVHGDVKTPPVAPAEPVATPEAPGRRLKVPGVILLCFGVFFSLISLLLGLPLIVCGVLCLCLKRRHGLWCCWTLLFSMGTLLFLGTSLNLNPFWHYIQPLILRPSLSGIYNLSMSIAINAITFIMVVWTIRSYHATVGTIEYGSRFLILGWSLTCIPDILQSICSALTSLAAITNPHLLGREIWGVVYILLQWIHLAGIVTMLTFTVGKLRRKESI